jgi:hypothetical protein
MFESIAIAILKLFPSQEMVLSLEPGVFSVFKCYIVVVVAVVVLYMKDNKRENEITQSNYHLVWFIRLSYS